MSGWRLDLDQRSGHFGTMLIDGILSLCREHLAPASAPSMRRLRSAPPILDEGEAASSEAASNVPCRRGDFLRLSMMCRFARFVSSRKDHNHG
jgi:hypothetical protein